MERPHGAARPARRRLEPARVALALAVVLVTTGLRVASEPSAGWADSGSGVMAGAAITLNPEADATVSADEPATNFGGGDLLVDKNPRLESYLRFEVPAEASGRAVLRLWVLDKTRDGPAVRRYDGPLDEAAITWENRTTGLSGTPVDSGSLGAGSWAEWDVSGLVAGPGDVTLALLSDSSDGADFGSRESDHSPQLVFADTAPTDPGPGPAAMFAPVADARVEEESPDENFGGAGGLAADRRGGIESYLRFPVAGLAGAVQRATLRLFVTDGTDDGPAIHPISGAWSEDTVTWAGRPGPTGAAVADLGPVARGWAEVDVTPAVAGTGDVDLALIADGSDSLWVRSREAGETERPVLVVETAGSATTTTSSSTSSPSTTTTTAPPTTTTSSSTTTTTAPPATTSSSTTTTAFPGMAPGCRADWKPAEKMNRLASGLAEMSAFVASPVHRDWGWGIRDSGKPASLYAMKPTSSGTVLTQEYGAYGLRNSDWEDMAWTPGFTAGSGHLWVLENVGNGWTGVRRIYQFEEPDPENPPPPPPTTSTTAVPPPPPPPPATLVGSYQWAYPDVQVNTETMFVFDGDLVVVTKTDPSRVYRFDGPLLPFVVNVPTYVGTLPVGKLLSTAAISADQRTLAVSNHGKVWVYENRGDVHDLAALISNFVYYQDMPSDNREGGSFFPYGSCDLLLVAESKTLWLLEHD